MSNLKESAVSGVFWVTAERFGIQFVNFLVSIILARLIVAERFRYSGDCNGFYYNRRGAGKWWAG